MGGKYLQRTIRILEMLYADIIISPLFELD